MWSGPYTKTCHCQCLHSLHFLSHSWVTHTRNLWVTHPTTIMLSGQCPVVCLKRTTDLWLRSPTRQTNMTTAESRLLYHRATSSLLCVWTSCPLMWCSSNPSPSVVTCCIGHIFMHSAESDLQKHTQFRWSSEWEDQQAVAWWCSLGVVTISQIWCVIECMRFTECRCCKGSKWCTKK